MVSIAEAIAVVEFTVPTIFILIKAVVIFPGNFN
jgi:hypothetical protein